MSYKYQEPQDAPEYEPLEAGEYDFYVTGVQDTYNNEKGTFILPVEITLKNTNIVIRQWLSAGTSAKGKPFDMIAPFLKTIRRNPAVDEEPDFSAKNLINAKGRAYVEEELYSGQNQKYAGKKFPAVTEWLYSREQTTATTSQGKDAKAKSYDKPKSEPEPPRTQAASRDEDDIPF